MTTAPTRSLAASYLQSTKESPWRWADRGRVIEWQDGTTIAFREEVEFVLDWLAPNGLPPFGAVVLLLAACRGKVPPHSPPPLRLLIDSSPVLGRPELVNLLSGEQHRRLASALDRLARLPQELLADKKGRAILAEIVFEETPGVFTGESARAVVRCLAEGTLTEAELNRPDVQTSPHWQANHLHLLDEGLKRLTSDALALRIRTGLDELPAEADVPLKPSERVRKLLSELRDDPEHAGLARVARDIMAAIYLPRALSDLEELALGGVSDITNRGSLDRLLLSELAHDDLTLAVRVALNEALYIRREPPVTHPPSDFAVLLDSGLRLWGVPRVFATAVALAMIAKDNTHARVSVYRARRNAIHLVDLFSRRGLVEHLAALETDAQPGSALKGFAAQLADAPGTEAVVITHRDALRDQQFVQALASVTLEKCYLATVDRDGLFQLHQHPFHGQKPLSQATIPLDELWQPPGRPVRPRAPLIDRRHDPELPLIFGVRPFPLLLPVRGKLDKVAALKHGGGVAVVDSRTLVHWQNENEGARTLTCSLPPGKTVWLHGDDFRKAHILKGRWENGALPLVSVHLDTGEVQTKSLPTRRVPTDFYFTAGVVFLVLRDTIHVFDLETGSAVQTIETRGRWWGRGKYWYGKEGWVVLNWDGIGASFQPVILSDSLRRQGIVRLFDRQGFEGPCCVTTHGRILTSAGEQIMDLGRNLPVQRISQDGHRLLITDKDVMKLVDLNRRTVLPVAGKAAVFALDPLITPPVRNVRNRFTHVFASPPDTLGLITPRGDTFVFELFPNGDLVLSPLLGAPKPVEGIVANRPFEGAAPRRDANCVLRVAKWGNGSRAYLDSRGLLHLKSSHEALPEASIVMNNGPLAAWSSDGLVCGPTFFTGNQVRCEPKLMWERIKAFVAHAV